MRKDILVWNYNVLIGDVFKVNGKHNDCNICNYMKALDKEGEPFNNFIMADVPEEELIELAAEHNVVIKKEDVEKHKKHIIPIIKEESRKKIKDDISIIQSELSVGVDINKVIKSTIRSLFAKKLALEQNSETDTREYNTTIQNLQKWTEMQLKLDGKINGDQGNTTYINLKDLILDIGVKPGEDDNKPTTATATTTKKD